MKLSIITINYNNKAGLEITIDSVMSQTWHDFEWVIIDGGSTDGSADVIAELANNPEANISFWCSEPDNGIYHALNKGISHCSGEYISCMNSSDSFYDSGTLGCIFQHSYASDILYGDRVLVNNNENNVIEKGKKTVDLYDIVIIGLCHQTMFVKTHLLQQRGFDESLRFVADCKRWIELALEGRSFEYVETIVCNYDMTGISSINQNEFHDEKFAMLNSTLPSTLLTSLIRLYQYEEGHLTKRCCSILANGGVRSYFLKFFLKFFA